MASGTRTSPREVDVILLTGPAVAGKTTTAGRIASHPLWTAVEEDAYWVQIKRGRPPGELRTEAEQKIVQAEVLEDVFRLLSNTQKLVVEFIVYEDPPLPLLAYRDALVAHEVPLAVRVLRPTVDEILLRMRGRRRPADIESPLLRQRIEQQLQCLLSPQVPSEWLIDSTGMTVDCVYDKHFKSLVEAPSRYVGRPIPGDLVKRSGSLDDEP